jgi:murein DD-endopeptidase MepM/ murein hydrolase activator NlpD
MRANDELPHQGITIGGHGYSGHEIIAPSEGIIVLSRDNHIRIHHGLDSKSQDVYTEHFHVHGRLPKEGDKVRRGENIGLIGPGKNTHLTHYHYVVIKKEGPQKFIALYASDYWFGIDEYNEKLQKGLDSGPFVIPCFDPSVNYPKVPIRFTYPVKCN